jgi:hypothetical protein
MGALQLATVWQQAKVAAVSIGIAKRTGKRRARERDAVPS